LQILHNLAASIRLIHFISKAMPGQSFFQLIRNATVVFYYAGKKFLIDPMLAPKDTYSGFEGKRIQTCVNHLVYILPVLNVLLYILLEILYR
jgi:hypothetical protein